MPASGAGIFKKLFGKHKNPLNTQRVVISNTQKYELDKTDSTPDLEPVDFTNIYEESFLEDTPAEGAVINKPDSREQRRAAKQASKKIKKSKGNNSEIQKTRETFRDDSAISPKTEGYRAGNKVSPKSREAFRSDYSEKRYKAKRKSIFSMFSAIPQIFRKKSKTSNSSALEFAESRRRLGKKGRKNRRIFIYAGTGLVVVILTLVIVFVPGQAAPVNTQSPGVSQLSTQGSYVAVNTAGVSASEIISGSPSESPSVSPTPTPTPIETTPPDVIVPTVDIDEEVKTYMVKADKYYTDMGYSPNHYKYTPDEKYILAQVISAEARGESFEGQIAVGNVIMNRVLNKRKFGNTIVSVVTANNQFAYKPDIVPTYSAKRAAEQVLDFEQWVIPQNTYYFRVSTSSDYWHGAYLKNIQHHAFYINNYSGRSSVKSVPPQLFKRTYKWPTMGCEPEIRVYKLQYMLNKLGYSKVVPDKYFGQDTKDAIIDFQKKHKLKADGIAGEGTLKKIIEAFGEDNYYEKFLKDKE